MQTTTRVPNIETGKGNSILQEGDIIELKEGMSVYATVPEHSTPSVMRPLL